jgi:hypothetical protein
MLDLRPAAEPADSLICFGAGLINDTTRDNKAPCATTSIVSTFLSRNSVLDDEIDFRNLNISEPIKHHCFTSLQTSKKAEENSLHYYLKSITSLGYP